MNRRWAWFRGLAITVGVMLLFAACSSDHDTSTAAKSVRSASSTSGARPSEASVGSMRLVVLGDSIASGETCVGCSLYPQQVAAAMKTDLGVEVEVSNLAVPGAEVADVLQLVRRDDTVRNEVASADAVIVTVGLNDLAFGRLDDPCGVETHFPRIGWNDITHACIDHATAQYRRDLDALLGEIQTLRDHRPTMLRVTTVYNSVIGDTVDPTWNSPDAIEPSSYAVEQMARTQCSVAEQHGGVCADTYHALNGKDGLASAQRYLNPADATHLAQAGEDKFAKALIDLGFSPLT